MKRLLQLHGILVVLVAAMVFKTNAQTTVTTGLPSASGSGSSANSFLTFIVDNTNSFPIVISDVEMYRGSGSNGNTLALYYSSTSLSGPTGVPVAVNSFATATGWTAVSSVTASTVTSNAIHPTFTNLTLVIPANTIYRFAVQTSGSSLIYGGSTATPNSFTNGGVTIGNGNYQISSANVGYWGATTPRFWCGSVTFAPWGPCTDPPTPGTVTVNNTTPCLGQSINLGIFGGTGGSGQTYQWESATSLSGPWTLEGSASATSSISVTPSAVGNTYYRSGITCGLTTVYSDTATITVPALFPGGIYTINSAQATGGTNFQSFTEAVNAIKCGITSSVVFNVATGSGPYNEQINLPATIGSNSTTTVTFNGNGATLTSAGTGANYATVNLDGADYITFNNLTIEATGATNGFAVHLMNGADENKFTNCNIKASTTATGTTSVGISMSNSVTSYSTGGINGSNNLFDSCTVTGGYLGVSFYSQATTSDSNNKITNSNIKDFYVYGVYGIYQRSGVISNNIIERPTRPTVSTGYGVNLTTGCVNMLVEKNTIRNMYTMQPVNTNTSYLIYCIVDGTPGRENKFINNQIYNIETNGTLYGFYLSGADYIQVYNNTIDLDYPSGTGGIAYGIFNTGTVGGIDIKNNNISIVKGGFDKKIGLYYTGAGAKLSNNNNIYISAPTGTGFVGHNGTDIATLSAWQAATGAGSPYDAQSTAEDPMFTSSSNLIPGNGALDNTGVPLALVTTDILNNPRSGSTPDIGAHEFVVLTCSGTVVAGTASTGDSTLCLGGPGTLSLSGYSIGQGISIQWEEASSNSGPWTPVAVGGTTSTYNFSFATPAYYRAAVTCAATSTTSYSNVLHITQSPFYFCYCSPLTGNVLHTSIAQYMSNVSISGTTLNNSTTAAGAGGYLQTDPTIATQTAMVFQNTPFNLNVTMTTTLGTTEAWIDWDQSGTFDASEYYPLVHTGTSGTVSITPPLGMPSGMTGLRLRVSYNSPNSFGASAACASLSTGRETEDYVITVMPPQTCPSSGSFTNVPATNSSTLSWVPTSTAALWQVEYGKGLFTLGTGTRTSVNIPSYTTPATLTGDTVYTYFVRDICGAGDTSLWSSRQEFYLLPPNDPSCSDAIDISNGVGKFGYNFHATQTQATCNTTSPIVNDVWYKFTTGVTAGSVTVTVNTTNTGFDAMMEAFDGTCGSLTTMTATAAGTSTNFTCIDGPAAGIETATYTVAANTTYYVRVYGFNTTPSGSFIIQVTGSPLAVKLDKISATNAGTANRVDWNTLSEESSDKFELQRSIDGKNFATIYEKRANGEASRYTYMDHNAVKGTNYYRLRMTAANGSVNYSEVVTAFVKSNGFEVDAYPNPVSHDLTVKVSGVQGADASVQVTDVTGKVIRTVKMNSSVETIDMSGLANGIYLIKYSDATHTQTIKVNKQ